MACEQNRTLDTRLQIVPSSVVAQHGGISIRFGMMCDLGSRQFIHIGVFDLETPWVVYVSELRAQIFGPILGMKELFVRILRYFSLECLLTSQSHSYLLSSPLSKTASSITPRIECAFRESDRRNRGETTQYETCVSTSFEISSSWSMIQTKSGELYGEYHGDPAISAFTMTKQHLVVS